MAMCVCCMVGRASGLALAYSIPLLLILLAHEFGHYFACRRWAVDASLPYFGPSPTLLGTVGAIILMRSPICNRKSLLDIGASGPIAGFVVLSPFLIAGVWMSRVVPGIQAYGPFAVWNASLLMRARGMASIPRSIVRRHLSSSDGDRRVGGPARDRYESVAC